MPNLNPGLIINQQYQLQRLIGRGGFSVVWLATDLQSAGQASVALKISLPDRDPASEMPKRMEQQYATTRTLDHPHMLRAYDYFMIEDAGCLVFEYMAKGTLHQRVREHGPLSEQEVAKVIEQVGSALQYLHQRALVHFDVKPENILIDATDNYFLSDFDTTSHLENSMVRVSRIYADTPQYRSPEHLRGAAELSEKADIFALGTTVFELCEGIMEKEFGVGMHLLAGNEKPVLQNEAYAKRLEQLIHACWNHNPADRPSAEALTTYAIQFRQYNYWPTIIEYRPDDQPIADLANQSGAETARITIGRPTVKNDYTSQFIEEIPFRATDKAELIEATETESWKPNSRQVSDYNPAHSKTSTVNKKTRYLLIGLLFPLLIVSGYFIWNNIQKRPFVEYLQTAKRLVNSNDLRGAYEAIEKARKLFPSDSSAILLRREILQVALKEHNSNLAQVRNILNNSDNMRYAEAAQMLIGGRNNASILVGDDSTTHYLTIITQRDNTIIVPPPPKPVIPEKEQIKDKEGDASQFSDIIKTDPVVPPTPPDEDTQKELDRIKEDNMWQDALNAKTKAAFDAYLNTYPIGVHVDEARIKIKEFEEKDDMAYSRPSISGMPYDERDKTCRQLIEGGTILITPKVPILLTELILVGDSGGKVSISIKGGNLSRNMDFSITSDRSQCLMIEKPLRLQPHTQYSLTVKPLANATGRRPMLEEMSNCRPDIRSDENLTIDYQNKYFIFDLKYKY